VLIFIVMALFAPSVAPHDPVATSWGAIRKAPSAAHWFGTDEIGRDVLSRVIWGTRASLLAGVVSVSISLLLGVPIGLAAGFIGGLGLAPGANIGEQGMVFEATHGSAPKYAGLNKVNPTAVILSGALMLKYMNETAAADKLERAVARVIAEGKSVTYDLKADRNDPSAVGTSQMADAIIARLR